MSAAQKTYTVSVLVPSYRRPERLLKCLLSLKRQTVPPDEVVVVYQGDDDETRNVAQKLQDRMPFPLRIQHSPERGYVTAVNAGLLSAAGDIIYLTDDDAVHLRTWIADHLKFYDDPSVGAVGGPVTNFHPLTGQCLPKRDCLPVGKLGWLGMPTGNYYDQPPSWTSKPAQEVDSLMGPNMTFRRQAVSLFEPGLKDYWDCNEIDACLQIKAKGYRIIFNFANPVKHYPRSKPHWIDRTNLPDSLLEERVYNPSYNLALILAKHTKNPIQRLCRFWFQIFFNSRQSPGILMWPASSLKYRHPLRELKIALRLLSVHLQAWRQGTIRKQSERN